MAYTIIDDPSEYFHTQLYTGTGSAQSITNDANAGDFQPDWVWIKARSEVKDHRAFDSTRGATKVLYPSLTNAEGTTSTSLTSFDSDGFSLGSSDGINKNTITYVGWQWKANGGTTATNDASSTSVGTIDSVYQANTTAGFSIVTYTGTGSAGTVAHGLGVAPTLIIGKDRDDTSQWFVQHPHYGATHYGELDDTTVFADDANYFNDSTPTSTVFGVGSDGATGGTTDYVAYCFAPIQGYSKFGSYTGNGNADGPFVYTGFKTKWLMTKRSNSAGSWTIFDNTLDDNTSGKHGNPNTQFVQANNSNAEATTGANFIDFLSNGFKCRGTDGGTNGNGDTYIYMAFAESPFVSSKGVPTTAR